MKIRDKVSNFFKDLSLFTGGMLIAISFSVFVLVYEVLGLLFD